MLMHHMHHTYTNCERDLKSIHADPTCAHVLPSRNFGPLMVYSGIVEYIYWEIIISLLVVFSKLQKFL